MVKFSYHEIDYLSISSYRNPYNNGPNIYIYYHFHIHNGDGILFLFVAVGTENENEYEQKKYKNDNSGVRMEDDKVGGCLEEKAMGGFCV